MNVKANALDLVRVNATLYFESQDEAKRNHSRLVEVVKSAKQDGGATQQEIADACAVGEHKLSRQRIAQLLQGA